MSDTAIVLMCVSTVLLLAAAGCDDPLDRQRRDLARVHYLEREAREELREGLDEAREARARGEPEHARAIESAAYQERDEILERRARVRARLDPAK